MSKNGPPDWTTLGRSTVFQNSFLRMETVERKSPRTTETGDFLVIHTADWITVIPFTADGRLILVEQFRHGSEEPSLEFPAGLLDPGELPERCAARELREETGWQLARSFFLGRFRPNPALQSNRCHVFAATGCVQAGPQQLDRMEDIVVRLLNPTDVLAAIASGQLTHAASLAALTKLAVWQGSSDLARALRDCSSPNFRLDNP